LTRQAVAAADMHTPRTTSSTFQAQQCGERLRMPYENCGPIQETQPVYSSIL
jgi:hypothetical protein